jgi:FixJ family two-component response regulator
MTQSIAIVDDDVPVLKALERLLRGRGFEVCTYRSAPEFLDGLPAARPDCLIVDLHMPEMTGLELHQNLAQRNIRIPTIVITALGKEEGRDRCSAAGLRFLLHKPVQPSELLVAIFEASESGRS